MILIVIDGSRPLTEEDRDILEKAVIKMPHRFE